jgi:hypothetical protein
MEYGSAERGLGMDDARAFTELLRANSVPLLGIELWRDTGNRLELDVSEINRVKTGPADVFAVQFS